MSMMQWIGKQLHTCVVWAEYCGKHLIFGCRMCGQCKLHDLGMTCPMTCPKQLRNGPCGGVRANGHCEVKPEMECRWVRAIRRATHAPWPRSWWRPRHINPAVDWRLQHTSSWINYFTNRDGHVEDYQREP
ncbi:MAG: hypothetical protein BWY76_01104 [bacterium ADurb.Bin429]|nr:MAG: hypothetical protein BWY76_01104 [bacterium ADurb.Bin429]